MRPKTLLLLGCCAVVTAGVSGCLSPYDRAVRDDTVAGWGGFLKECPDSPHVAEARQRLRCLLGTQRRLLQVSKVAVEYVWDKEGVDDRLKEALRYYSQEIISAHGWTISPENPELILTFTWDVGVKAACDGRTQAYFLDRVGLEIRFPNSVGKSVYKSSTEIPSWPVPGAAPYLIPNYHIICLRSLLEEAFSKYGLKTDMTYWENGKLCEEINYYISESGDRVRHGTYTKWFENGQKWRQIEYVHGKMHGRLTEWHHDGTKANGKGEK